MTVLSGLFSATAQPFEEVLHWNFERKRKLVQRTSGYSVDRPLVFLKLLERDAERVGNHFLGQARFLPPQEHARCDVAINRVGKTVRHNQRRLDRFVPWCAQLRRWVQLGSKGLTVRFSCTTLGEQNR
jgi:hypothetical protein